MREELAIWISIVAIGAAISQLAFWLYRRNSEGNRTDVEVTIADAPDDQTRSISVTPRNIKSVENLLSAMSRQSDPHNDESTHQ